MKRRISREFYLYLGICLFLITDILYYIKPLTGLDTELLCGARNRFSLFHPVFLWIAKYMNLYILTLLVVVFLYFMKKKTIAYWLAGNTVIVGLGFNFVLKNIFRRERPTIIPQLIQEHSFSFPSGSTLVSTLLFGGLLLAAPKLVKRTYGRVLLRMSMVVLILLVGLSRIYVGVHYPTDVIAGICLGFSSLFISGYFIEKQNRPNG